MELLQCVCVELQASLLHHKETYNNVSQFFEAALVEYLYFQLESLVNKTPKHRDKYLSRNWHSIHFGLCITDNWQLLTQMCLLCCVHLLTIVYLTQQVNLLCHRIHQPGLVKAGCRIGPSVVIGPDVTIEDGMTKHLIRRVKVWCLLVLKWWLTVIDQLTNCFHTWGACCRVNCRVE